MKLIVLYLLLGFLPPEVIPTQFHTSYESFCQMIPNMQLGGDFLKEMTYVTEAECAKECMHNELCQTLSYNENARSCTLRSSKDGYTYDVDEGVHFYDCLSLTIDQVVESLFEER